MKLRIELYIYFSDHNDISAILDIYNYMIKKWSHNVYDPRRWPDTSGRHGLTYQNTRTKHLFLFF